MPLFPEFFSSCPKLVLPRPAVTVFFQSINTRLLQTNVTQMKKPEPKKNLFASIVFSTEDDNWLQTSHSLKVVREIAQLKSRLLRAYVHEIQI